MDSTMTTKVVVYNMTQTNELLNGQYCHNQERCNQTKFIKEGQQTAINKTCYK